MFTEDLTVFFDQTSGFASEAVGFNVHGQEVSFSVIFDAEHTEVLDGMAADVAPQITVPTASVADVHWAAGLRIDGTFWKVAGVPRPDGTGVSTVALRRINV